MPVGTAPRTAGDAEGADLLFHALSDATRRRIVVMVLRDDHSVSDLARRFPMSFAAVQKHVAVLEKAGLVTKHRHGREQRVRGNVEALRRARDLLDQLEAVWRSRLDRIGDLLTEPPTDPSTDDIEPPHQGAAP